MERDEFYIGWMSKAPEGIARVIRKSMIILLLVVLAAGTIIVLGQKRFSTGNFEYGQTIELEGLYQEYPVPSIKIATKTDLFGHNSMMTIPLVGYGKSGAQSVIAAIEKENGIDLDKKQVLMRGTLIYSDGKALLQIDVHDKPLKRFTDVDTPLAPSIKELGRVKLTGEILDPKCYFGVMKPGHGKPHRDCAIRCISGGISPVFCIRNEKGEANYCLILGPDGEPINEELKDYIAEPVSIEARAVQVDDWIVLYLDGAKCINRLGGLSWFKRNDEVISCGTSSQRDAPVR